MCEECYVLINENEEEKIIELDKKIFALGSDEAKQARNDFEKIIMTARKKQYKIKYKDMIIYDPEVEKQKEEKRQATSEKYMDAVIENVIKLQRISNKDILDLTEEEIVLLAQSRVHGDRTIEKGGQIVRESATTFEREYNKIKANIDQKRREIENRRMTSMYRRW